MEAMKSHLSEAEVWGETTITVQWDDGPFPSATTLAAETVIIALFSWYYRTFTAQKKEILGGLGRWCVTISQELADI